MIGVLALAVAVAASPAPGVPCSEAMGHADDQLQQMYDGGETFQDFLENARRRREMWLSNYAEGEIPSDLLQRARSVPGTWRLLVVAIDGCSDSVSTVPYVARLVEQVEGLDMRIVDSQVGHAVMEAHPTPDARAATPTLVLLDADWNEAGCFIERPQDLQAWLGEAAEGLGNQAFYEAKMGWYAEDAGISTVRQLVEMMEAAAAGAAVCR